MVTGKERIEYNYREMLDLVAEINDIAAELENIKASFDGTLTSLSGFWQGRSADDYRNQGAGVSQFMGKHVSSARSLASGIKRTAIAYREAEMQKLENE